MKRGHALCVALLSCVFVLWQTVARAQPVQAQPLRAERPLHFLVFGDWGTANQQQKDVAEAMARYAESNKVVTPVGFAISVGDNFYEDGVSSVDDPQWQTKFEQIYDIKRLNFPFYAVLGNHDWHKDPVAQISYGQARPGTRWQMDGFWYKRHYFYTTSPINSALLSLADFFFLDTDLFNPSYKALGLADKQLAWLTEQLKNSRARWQFVVGHHGLYSNGDHGHEGDILKLRKTLGPLFKQYGVDAYFAGHDHDLQRNEVAGESTLFLISGAAGKLRSKKFNDYGPFYAATAGYLAIQLTPTEMRGQFLDTTGKSLDSFYRAPVEAMPASPIASPVVAPPANNTTSTQKVSKRLLQPATATK